MKKFIILFNIFSFIFSCPDIKFIEGGLSGSGAFKTFWDCCKPDCSSSQIAGLGNEARQCNKAVSEIRDSKSMCEGGPSTTCITQIPFTIDECNNIGFAFTSIQAYRDKNLCGKCFLLQYKGDKSLFRGTNQGKSKLSNKKIIVMAINIDSVDTENYKFQLMIPGGGQRLDSIEEFNHYNYRPNYCYDTFGNKYNTERGVIEICEKEVSGDDDNSRYINMKKCIANKCNVLDGKARNGCMFQANFLEGINFGEIDYKEIECPNMLKDLY